MKVDPDRLAGAATSLARCAEDLGSSLESLQSTVTTNNPWGNDEPGSLFGAAYVEVLHHAMEVYDSHLGLLVEAARNLAEWSARLRRTEQQNVARFDRLGSGPGSSGPGV